MLEDNFLLLIDGDGNILESKKSKDEYLKHHKYAFDKIDEIKDNLADINTSGGFDISITIAKAGYVVIVPDDINFPNYITFILPEELNNKQINSLIEVVDNLEGYNMYAAFVVNSSTIVCHSTPYEIFKDNFYKYLNENRKSL